jgi:hypothetical protein
MSPCDIPECLTAFVTSSDTTNFTRSTKEEGTPPNSSMKRRASEGDRGSTGSGQVLDKGTIPPIVRYPVAQGRKRQTPLCEIRWAINLRALSPRASLAEPGSARQVQNHERRVICQLSGPMGPDLCDETPGGLASRHVLEPLEGLHEPGVAEGLASVGSSLDHAV